MKASAWLKGVLVVSAIFILLQLGLESLDVYTTVTYTLSSSSTIAKAAAVKRGTLGAIEADEDNPINYDLDTILKENRFYPCVRTPIKMGVFPTHESFTLKYHPKGITLYDCLNKHLEDDSADADDDKTSSDPEDVEDCPAYEIALEQIEKGRFESDHVQRLIPCPLKPLEGDASKNELQCPTDKNDFKALTEAGADFKYANCETERITDKCQKRVNRVFRDWKWWGFSISTAYVIGLIAVIVFGVDGESLNGAERGGYILIGVAHVAALIGAIMYISDIVQLPASDGDCLGQYLTEDLGYTEQSTNTSHQTVVAALQITTIVIGIAFWAAAAVATTLYKGNLDGTTDSPSE